MPRVDVWDVLPPEADKQPELDCGYPRGLELKYDLARPLGEGGFGSVRVGRRRRDGAEFAVKSIRKRLDVANVSRDKQAQHLAGIKREVQVLRKLRGALNVVALEEVLEDGDAVHIVMELCTGGELFQRIGGKRSSYSEQTVASYMRAVLRTLAQCHARRILHRDVKPGNFMLLTDADDAPVKAIDFGLAVFFDPAHLPLTHLGLEGTPWYMAPEVLSSAAEPASDVFSAGVMAYQMLSGRFPFDDRDNADAPALSKVWKAILTEEPRFGSAWADVSEPAVDFCRRLLDKDPRKRPTARQALEHPWLAGGRARSRGEGKQLTSVVQRLQRYGQQNAFRRTVLDMIANELLRRHVQALDAEAAGGGSMRAGGGGGSMRAASIGAGGGGGSMRAGALGGGSLHGAGGGSQHGWGSVRGSMTALEALRRARERRSYADLAGLGASGGESTHGAAAMAATLAEEEEGAEEEMAPNSRSSSPPAPPRSLLQSAASSPLMGGGELGGAASWERRFMARRLGVPDEGVASLRRARSVRLEGTWHGAAGGGLGSPSGGGGAHGGERSWHGGAAGGGADAEFLRFLEQSRRKRQEARKVARLVLESATRADDGGGEAPDFEAPGLWQGGGGDEEEDEAAAAAEPERRRAASSPPPDKAGGPSSSGRGAKRSLVARLRDGVGGVVRSFSHRADSSAVGVSGRASSSSVAAPPVAEEAACDAINALARSSLVPTEAGGDTPRSSNPSRPTTPSSLAPRDKLPPPSPVLQPAPPTTSAPAPAAGGEPLESGGRRGQGAYAALMLGGDGGGDVGGSGGGSQAEAPAEPTPPPLRPLTAPKHVGFVEPEPQPAPAPLRPLTAPKHVGFVEPVPAPLRPLTAPKHVGFVEPEPVPPASAPLRPLTAPKHVGFVEPAPSSPPAAKPSVAPAGATASPPPASLQAAVQRAEARAGGSGGARAAASNNALPAHVRDALRALRFNEQEALTTEQLQQRLHALGYRLTPGEVADLAREIGAAGGDGGAMQLDGDDNQQQQPQPVLVNKAAFAASQMDWDDFQVNHRDEWLDCLRSTFDGLSAGSGRIGVQELVALLAAKLPESEVNAAIEDVLLEAAADEDAGLDFAAFSTLLGAASAGGGGALSDGGGSRDSLDQYDARLSFDAGGSARGGDGALRALVPVPEGDA